MNYNAQESAIKHGARIRLLSRVVEQFTPGQPLKCLTLPNEVLWYEEQIMKLYPGSQIVCFEKDVRVYRKMRHLMPKHIVYEYDDIFLLKNGKFDHCWLDFCSWFSTNFINSNLEFIQNGNLAAKFVHSITAKRNQEQVPSPYFSLYEDYKSKGFAEHLKTVLPPCRSESYNYRCKDNKKMAAPMVNHTLISI